MIKFNASIQCADNDMNSVFTGLITVKVQVMLELNQYFQSLKVKV